MHAAIRSSSKETGLGERAARRTCALIPHEPAGDRHGRGREAGADAHGAFLQGAAGGDLARRPPGADRDAQPGDAHRVGIGVSIRALLIGA